MPLRRAVFSAAAAAAAGALLIGGGTTYAAWSDSTQSESMTITAGTLKADITQSEPTDVTVGSNPSIVTASGSHGIIPGLQAQRWKYTIENSKDSATPATVTLDFKGTPIRDSGYADMWRYLKATATVESKRIDIPSKAFGSDGFFYSLTLNPTDTLDPGQSVDVYLDLSIPAEVKVDGRTVDLAVKFLNQRSADTKPLEIINMENSAQLEQATTKTS